MDYKLEEQHHLLRLNFAPQHIIDGKVIPAAISSEDLQRRGYSLDSEILISIETLTERAVSQSAKKPEERKSPHISRFLCGEAASIKYDDIYAFNIFYSPVPEDAEHNTKENKAHVSLLCTDTSKGPSYYKKAKTLLLPVLQNLITLSNYVEQFQAKNNPEDEGTVQSSN